MSDRLVVSRRRHHSSFFFFSFCSCLLFLLLRKNYSFKDSKEDCLAEEFFNPQACCNWIKMKLPFVFCLLFLSTSLVICGKPPAGQQGSKPMKAPPGLRNKEAPGLRNKDDARFEARAGGSRPREQRSGGDIPDCQETIDGVLGAEYNGTISVTESGRTCQVWSANEPHEHDDHHELGDHNYCRNPDDSFEGVWCFTTDPLQRWETCSQIPKCASKTTKVFNFDDDYDEEYDENGELSCAYLDTGKPLPETWTLCSSFMVDAWMMEFSSADLFVLDDFEGDRWAWVHMFAASDYTEYEATIGGFYVLYEVPTPCFGKQWPRVCISQETDKIRMVVDGQDLGEKEYSDEEDTYRPTNVSLRLGCGGFIASEYLGTSSDCNMFDSALPLEKMIALTTAGGEDCGAAGNFISWEETTSDIGTSGQWKLTSKAKVLEVDKAWGGSCRKESKIQVFKADADGFEYDYECMYHCQVEGYNKRKI